LNHTRLRASRLGAASPLQLCSKIFSLAQQISSGKTSLPDEHG